MGLDMYLLRKTYVKNWDHMSPKEITTISVMRNGEPLPGIDPSKIREVVEEVAYWRKANQIHNWFVEEVQNGVDDCGEYNVELEELQDLVDRCKKVLVDHALAPELLPTGRGFFFGGTEYDEWYYADLENTIEQLEPLLVELDAWTDLSYHSSW
jgi:hypothetical protein